MNLNTLLWRKKKIIFIATGRTASTAGKRAIAVDEGIEVSEGESPHFNPMFTYMDDPEKVTQLLDMGWRSMVVERDPKERFVSWWRSKVCREVPSVQAATAYGFKKYWSVSLCAFHLADLASHSLPGGDPIKANLETHLAPQKFIQRTVLRGRRPDIIIPFSGVTAAWKNLFDITLPEANVSSVCKPLLSVSAAEVLDDYYHEDKGCLK